MTPDEGVQAIKRVLKDYHSGEAGREFQFCGDALDAIEVIVEVIK